MVVHWGKGWVPRPRGRAGRRNSVLHQFPSQSTFAGNERRERFLHKRLARGRAFPQNALACLDVPALRGRTRQPQKAASCTVMKLQAQLGHLLQSADLADPRWHRAETLTASSLFPTILHPSEMFWRQLRFADFDVSEMSVSSLLMVLAGGDQHWLGLPVFTTRRFLPHRNHGAARFRDRQRRPDLKGRRVGVPEISADRSRFVDARRAAARVRGGGDRHGVLWMERVPTHSHAGAVAFKPPPRVIIHQIPPEKRALAR